MTGHRLRQKAGAPRRSESRRHRMAERLARAVTAEAQLAAAFDWFRSASRHVKDPNEQARLMRHASEFLANAAAEIERGQR